MKINNSRFFLKLPYPENLIKTICQNQDMTINDEQVLGFQKAFEQLAPMEQMVLKCRFKDRQTFKQIGVSVNRTTDKAYLIYQHGIRKLRNPYRHNMIVLGYHRALEVFTKEESSRI